MTAAALVDTNVLVYVHDPRHPGKQQRAIEVIDQGIRSESLVVPHQAVVEFVAVTTRLHPGGFRMLTTADAHREAEELLLRHEILYPDENVVRMAFLGAEYHRLSWYDAHLWAYAAVHGIPEILSEDFQHGRAYGKVKVVNPFTGL